MKQKIFEVLGSLLNSSEYSNPLSCIEILYILGMPVIIYIIMFILLKTRPERVPGAIYIKGCSKSFTEIFILLKTEEFKNSPSGTLYLFQAIGRTAIVVECTLLISILYINKLKPIYNFQYEIDPLTLSASIIILITAFYWNERNSYVSKWEYLANLYNKHFEFNTAAQYEMAYSSLIHDIHLTELWGHKTFFEIFRDAICKTEGIDPKADDFLIRSEKHVERLLEKYHSDKKEKFRNFCASNEFSNTNRQNDFWL